VVDLREVYDFDPAPAELTAAEQAHVLGLEASLWTEHMRTARRVEHMAFPRAAAVAELGWSQPATHSWTDFSRRLVPWSDRYRMLGVNAAETQYDVKVEAELDRPSATAVVRLSTRSDNLIRFTTDGTAPTARSKPYVRPLVLGLPTRLRAAAFEGSRRLGEPVARDLDPVSLRHRWSQELRTCTNKLVLNLEDDAPAAGPRAFFLIDIMNPCWIWRDADLTGVGAIAAGVGQVPFNFQIGADRAKIVLHPPQTPQGELEVRMDGCDGERIASLPLAPAAASQGVTAISAALPPRRGRHDLCFSFTGKGIDPMWAIDWVQLQATATAAGAEG
jgi:hexosaminidase